MTFPVYTLCASAITISTMLAVPATGQSCGGWAITPNPTFDGDEFRPTLIAAFAPDSAVALGLLPGTGLVSTTWNGTTWSAGVHNPPDLPAAAVRAVTGTNINDYWITGEYAVNTSTYWPYLAHFDGRDWNVIEGSLLDAPNSAQRSGGGSDIVVIAPDDIWAVGVGDSVNSAPPNATLAPISMHWNGSTYEEFVPQVQPVYNSLNRVEAIEAAASDAVWFVGSGRNLGSADTNVHLVIYHFDGSSWTPHVQWTQLPGSQSLTDQLFDIVALAPDDVWAFGQKLTLPEGTSSLYLHWDGSSWTEIAGPNIGPITSAERGGADEIWASCAFGEYGGVLAHFDGTSWTAEPSAPIAGATHIGLTNLAASPSGDVWAVAYWGIYNPQGGWDVYQDILEHYVPACAGDMNADGFVNQSDLGILLSNFGCAARDCIGDLDGDGHTDQVDLGILLANFDA